MSTRFAAFGSRNFRLYFAGQLLSTVGTFMQTLANGWLVLELTGRSDRLGVAVGLQFAPLLLLGLFTGVIADKFDNRRLLMGASILSATIALAQTYVVASDRVTIAWIYVFALAFGLIGAIERPAMQAIVFELSGADRLPSAIAINGTIQTTGRLLGPGIAGLLIDRSGVEVCFLLNSVSFAAVVIALALLRDDEMQRRPLLTRTAGQMREGLRYIRSQPAVLQPLVIMLVVGLISYNFQTTIPALIKFAFDRGAGAIGALQSISAIGSVAGGYIVAGLKPSWRFFGLASAAFGAGLLAMGGSPNFAVLLIVCVPTGVASAFFTTMNVAVIQQATEPAMQGRVMGLHQMAWQGTTPIGALLMGWLIEATSARLPFYLGGATAVLCGLYVLGQRRRRVAVESVAVTSA